MNGSRIHVDMIIDTTWIPRENCTALKIYPRGIHVVFFSPFCNLYYIRRHGSVSGVKYIEWYREIYRV